jgi:hypothetical protein
MYSFQTCTVFDLGWTPYSHDAYMNEISESLVVVTVPDLDTSSLAQQIA